MNHVVLLFQFHVQVARVPMPYAIVNRLLHDAKKLPNLPERIASHLEFRGDSIAEAIEAGARGYVVKEEASEELLAAIRAVFAGELYLSRKMSAGLLGELLDGNRPRTNRGLERLSNRELQVLRLLGRGQTTREVATQLKRRMRYCRSLVPDR